MHERRKKRTAEEANLNSRQLSTSNRIKFSIARDIKEGKIVLCPFFEAGRLPKNIPYGEIDSGHWNCSDEEMAEATKENIQSLLETYRLAWKEFVETALGSDEELLHPNGFKTSRKFKFRGGIGLRVTIARKVKDEQGNEVFECKGSVTIIRDRDGNFEFKIANQKYPSNAPRNPNGPALPSKYKTLSKATAAFYSESTTTQSTTTHRQLEFRSVANLNDDTTITITNRKVLESFMRRLAQETPFVPRPQDAKRTSYTPYSTSASRLGVAASSSASSSAAAPLPPTGPTSNKRRCLSK
jgi:hypothetical protein